MAANFTQGIAGISEAVEALKTLVPKLRVRAIRNALAGGGRVFRDEARRLTPILQVNVKSGKIRRTPGTVRKAITVRTSKQARRAGDVGVFVNVRPAKKGTRGANSPTDPFYWRFLEFGTKKMRAFEFLQTAGRTQGQRALGVITSLLGPAVQKLNQKNSRP